MKFTFAISLLLFQCGISLAQQDVSGCLTAVDPSFDYFVDKVTPVASKSWSIEYFNTYKILTNLAANETYLLYQCGSEIPANETENGSHSAIVQIPVSTVGIGVTTIIPQLEQLGVVDSIISFTTDPAYVSSPCLLSNIAEGNVIVLQTRDEYANYTSTPESTEETLMKLQNTVGFTDEFNESPPFNVSVKISEYTETTNAGIFEWIKFFSAFYNLEAKANEVFNTTETRWDCVSEASSAVSTSDNPDDVPVVLWMTYSDYCGGWDIGTCPNYYCEFIEQCSATIVETTLTGNYSEICFDNFFSIDEVVEIGRDADYWFYLASDWNETYTLFKDKLDTMTVVQDMQVYDFQGSGPGAWFETRAAEYFVVLQDFCSVVGTVSSPLTVNRTYFRNVMDGSPVGSIGTECTESSRSSSILPVVGAVCDDLNVPVEVEPVVNNTNVPATSPPTPLQCVEVDPNTDYFFNKVTPVASKSWSIEYFNTYKILTNLAANETYLLYQCGSEIPANETENGSHSAIVQIPVSTVGIGVTTIIPQLEQLGVVDSIISFTTDPAYVSSPCLLSNIADGNVIVLETRGDYDNYTVTPESTEETLVKLQNTVGFTDEFNESPPFNVSVKISEYTETTNAGIFEWIKFFSAFYNLEAEANEVFDTTETRWKCVSEAASAVSTSDNPDDIPVVLWMTYSAYCGGWDIGTCPNFYCEFIEQCSATIIETTLAGNYSDICFKNYFSIDEVVEIGRDADYWFYLASDWNETYTLFKDKLDTMTVVQDMQVYDFQGSGPGAWFETRAAEYFVVLQDFCSVVGTVSSPLTVNRTYFRNVMDGSPVGSIGTECTESSRSSSILPVVGAVCDDLDLPDAPTAPTPTIVTAPTAEAPTAVTPTSVTKPIAPTVVTTSGSFSVRFLFGVCMAVIVAIVV